MGYGGVLDRLDAMGPKNVMPLLRISLYVRLIAKGSYQVLPLISASFRAPKSWLQGVPNGFRWSSGNTPKFDSMKGAPLSAWTELC